MRLSERSGYGNNLLKMSATAWFTVAVCGQLIFALYMAWLYGGSALRGDFAAWGSVMPKGWINGDRAGNTQIALHLFGALIITVLGPLQFVSAIRARIPAVHRWIGRSYVTLAVLAAVTGLYLIWVRGTVGDVSQHLGTSFNALLIVVFGWMAWQAARARDFAAHRRWALRFFLVVSGVWFFRVGLMAWLIAHRAPVGFDAKTFTGPFLSALAFAQTLLPLAVLELYLRAQRSPSRALHVAAITALIAATLVTAAGVFGASMQMWIPRMK